MKKPLSALLCSLSISLFSIVTTAQSFNTFASAVWITDCNQSNFYNTTGVPADLFGPAGNVFSNANLGVHTQNSGTLILRGAGVKTSKTPGAANVCSVRMFYRIYLQSGPIGGFNNIDLPLYSDCDIPSNQFINGGGPCQAGDQVWRRVIADGTTIPYSPINLTNFAAGSYVLEVYYEITGSNSSPGGCSDQLVLDNGGNYYKAFFSIQSPTFASNNPVTCNGNEGYITIGGLTAGATYAVSYTDDGVAAGPISLTANASGQIVITGLNAGLYSNFSLSVNGCTTNLFIGIVLSNPIFIPTFASVPPICEGSTPPTLPTSSGNGISGTWSPATINNTATGTYAFTPASGQCGIPITITVTVIPRTTPTFTFGTSLNICAGGSVPILSNTSTNGITGTWSPAVVDPQNPGTYTFTPNAGQCANPATFTVTVTPNITPTFSFGTSLSFCTGSSSAPALPNTSDNGITGTWNPTVIDNQNSGTYTFTPNAGQCAVPTTLTITVNPNITPSFAFGTSINICAGGSVPTLPTTSGNGITGTWNPAVVNPATSGTYTFTPDAGQCAIPATLNVSVDPNITPVFSFDGSLTICSGGSVPGLPNTSTNGISGTWNPSVVDPSTSGTYTFTPNSGQCATTATFTVTVNPNITPSFEINIYSICAGSTSPVLLTTSLEGITGTWSPAVVDNQNSGIYTFLPNPGQCAVTTTVEVWVSPNVTPTFNFPMSLTICSGGTVPVLPPFTNEGFTGVWSPAVVSNTSSGIYTFTPDAGQCAVPVIFTATVNATVTPTFSFGTSLNICTGGSVPALPNTSDNGVPGTWSPSVVSNTTSGTYTFTPSGGQCTAAAIFTVTVNPILTPTFSFGTSLIVCSGNNVPALPTTSTNGVAGTWSPSVIDNQNSGTYTFTPDAGQCAVSTTLTVTISPNITPSFSIGSSLTICNGGTVPALPVMSDNGVTGIWNPVVVSNTASATYTFIPDASQGPCIATVTYTVTVNPIITPTFSFGNMSICIGASVPALPASSQNNITGTWSPASIDNQNSGSYIFTPDAGQCANPVTITVAVNVVPTVTVRADTTLNDGDIMPATFFTGTPAGISFNWTNSNPGIGLTEFGTGNVPSFVAVNKGNAPVTATISVKPANGGCEGAVRSYKITVNALNKDIFVPNVFSPNGDGKNDKLFAYGNYVDKLEMRIFNQWGEQIIFINSMNQGWDGSHRGKQQPVGVYVYVLKATMTDGRVIQLKGSITLLR
jgi:gliding motility-associated-like protein